MFFRLAADLLVVIHLAFIIFVVCGGFLAIKWRWIVYFHIPAALWGAVVEFSGWICPLTPWENQLRQAGGEAGYSGGFIQHYLLPLIYPESLTRELQISIGLFVVVVNVIAYWIIMRRKSFGN